MLIPMLPRGVGCTRPLPAPWGGDTAAAQGGHSLGDTSSPRSTAGAPSEPCGQPRAGSSHVPASTPQGRPSLRMAGAGCFGASSLPSLLPMGNFAF